MNVRWNGMTTVVAASRPRKRDLLELLDDMADVFGIVAAYTFALEQQMWSVAILGMSNEEGYSDAPSVAENHRVLTRWYQEWLNDSYDEFVEVQAEAMAAYAEHRADLAPRAGETEALRKVRLMLKAK